MSKPFFETDFLSLSVETSEIPWIKIFTKKPYKELSDCDKETKQAIYQTMEIVEVALREFYKPTKINIAMFGNYVPHLHVHVMARFENDSFFPEPMWGKKQRDGSLILPPIEDFLDFLNKRL